VSSVTVDGLVVNVVRYPDGTLSWEDVAQSAAAADDTAPAADAKAASDLSGYVVGALEVQGATIHLEDRAAAGAPAVADIRDLDLRVAPLGVGRPIEVSLALAAFEPARNLWVEADLAPLPPDAKVEDPASLLRRLHVRATGVDLARLAPYAGSLPVQLDSAHLVADLELRAAPGAPATAKGSLELKGVQARGGVPFDLAFRPDLTLDRQKGVLDVRAFELAVGDVHLAAKGRVAGVGQGLAALQLDGVEVRSDSLDVGKLLRYWPVPDAPFTTEGAGRLEVKVSGDPGAQKIGAALDFTSARVIVPGKLDKPAGVPLALQLDGAIDPHVAQLSAMSLRFGGVEVTGDARLDEYKGPAPRTLVRLNSKGFSFGELARLVPAVQQGLPAGAKVGGNGTLSFLYDGTPSALNVDLQLVLVDVDLTMPGTRLAGGARLTARVKGDPARDLAVDASLDARDATIVVDGSVDKAAGVPLDLDLAVTRKGPVLDVRRAALLLGALRVDGAGSMNQETGALDMKVNMPPLDLGALARTFPAVKGSGLAGGTLSTRLSVDGNPQIPETLALVLGDLRYAYGKSSLTGTVRLQNPVSPRVVADLSSPYFDLDQVMPPTEEEKAAKAHYEKTGEPEKKKCPPPSDTMKKLHAEVALRVAQGVVSEIPFRDLDAKAELKAGVLRMDRWSVQVYGGTVSGRSTSMDLGTCVGEWMADLTVDGVDAGQLLQQKTKLGGAIAGKLKGRVIVNGKGLDRYHMTTADPEGRRASGVIESELGGARWSAASLSTAVLGPASKLVPGLTPKAERELGTVASSFDVKDGRFLLAKPMKIASGDARTELTGSIGMDHTLKLAGTYFAQPQAIAAISGGRCRPSSELALPLSIEGTLTAPKIAPGDAGKIAKVLATACLGGKMEAAKEKVEEAIAQKKDEVVSQAKDQVEQARAAAAKQVEDQKKATTKQAEDQAKKAGKKLLKGLGF
jgi:hypothetical protein